MHAMKFWIYFQPNNLRFVVLCTSIFSLVLIHLISPLYFAKPYGNSLILAPFHSVHTILLHCTPCTRARTHTHTKHSHSHTPADDQLLNFRICLTQTARPALICVASYSIWKLKIFSSNLIRLSLNKEKSKILHLTYTSWYDKSVCLN